jgi:glucose/arabinose dehydrogenase
MASSTFSAAVVVAVIAAGCPGSGGLVASGGPGMPTGEPPPALAEPPAELAAQVKLEKVVARTDGALAFVQAPGDPTGRFHLVEKKGRIHVVEEGVAREPLFLDVSDRVSGRDEQGLLGLAFHPSYVDNGRFFVNYTDREGDTRVVEYRLAAGTRDRADPSSAKEWLFVDQPMENHNGGHVLFGPDGKLWIGLGDGGTWHDQAGNSQSDSSLLGKMLRLDVDAGTPGAKPEILMKGLRNPWRYSFDRRTNDLYIADVGQELWEEIDVLPAASLTGHNLGWPVTEGFHCYRYQGCSESAYVPPVLEYGHDAGCSITGGHVYRGAALPALEGHYFYADYCSGLLRSLRWRDGKIVESWDWKKILDPSSRLANVSAFAEDSDGEIYVITMWDGIYKLVPVTP